jgi:hypothetical protein
MPREFTDCESRLDQQTARTKRREDMVAALKANRGRMTLKEMALHMRLHPMAISMTATSLRSYFEVEYDTDKHKSVASIKLHRHLMAHLECALPLRWKTRSAQSALH